MYNPADYWEERLSSNFNLRGVGHQSFSLKYNYWLYKRKKQVLNQIFSNVNLQQKSVLDVGCGTGFFMDWYLAKGALVDGIDISAKAINELRKDYPEANLTQADFSHAGLKFSKVYDIVNVWDVVYHQADDASFERFLTNCAQACKPKGWFICTDGFGLPKSVDAASHVRFRNRSNYQPLMNTLGFELHLEIPLYRFLNRSPGNGISQRIQNHLGAIFYQMDQFQKRLAKNNLSVSIWIKN